MTDIPHPGITLKAAREKKNITLLEIEKTSRIAKRRLELLEEGDFKAIGSDIFVIGYMRKVAAIVDIDPEPLIADFKQNFARESANVQTKESIEQTQTFINQQIKSNDAPSIADNTFLKKNPKFPLFLGSLLILAILFFIYYSLLAPIKDEKMAQAEVENSLQEEIDSAELQTSSENKSITIASPETLVVSEPVEIKNISINTPDALDVTIRQVEVNDVLVKESDEKKDTQKSGLSESVTSSSGDNANNSKVSDAVINDEIVTQETAFQEAITQASYSETASINSAVNKKFNATKANVEKNALMFSLNADCWIQVVDSKNKKLISATRLANTHFSVKGIPPYKVIVGNVKAVNLTYNGEPVNIVASSNRKLSKFTVN